MISNPKLRKLHAPFLAILGAFPFLVLSVWNLWIPYSYWYDELYSVVASSGSWNSLFDSLLKDVHPPLYQVILKLWMGVFGNGEIQVRMLSSFFAIMALTLFIWLLRDRRPIFLLVATTFFTSSYLFIYYSQEARGYSLLLLLATTATIMDFHRIREPGKKMRFHWYCVLFALSLVHYFGLALACLLLLFDIFRQFDRRAVLERIALGALMLVWPALHFFVGSLGGWMGGNHWIKSEGIATTVGRFGKSIFAPPLVLIGQMELIFKSFFILFNSSILVFLFVLPIFRISGIRRKEMVSLLFRIVGFISIIALIDLHTPVSVPRYYIVLLPAVAILFACSIHFWWKKFSRSWQRLLLSLGMVLYFGASGIYAYNWLKIGWGPNNGWKALAEVVNKSGICRPHCWFFNESSRLNLYSYYFEPSMGSEPEKSILSLNDLLSLPVKDQRPIVAAHIRQNAIEKLRAHYPGWQCLEPFNASQTPVVLFVPEEYTPQNLKPFQ